MTTGTNHDLGSHVLHPVRAHRNPFECDSRHQPRQTFQGLCAVYGHQNDFISFFSQEKMCAFKTQLREGLGKAGPLGRHVSQAVVALEDQPKAVVVAAESFFFFLLFFLAFLPIPAIIFTALENQNGTMWENGDWTFPDSLYYTFITLRFMIHMRLSKA